METSSEAAAPIDREILIFAVVTLIVVSGAESLVVAWGWNNAVAAASAVARQPDHLLAFIKSLSLVVLPLAALNAGVGAWIARRLSTPLARMRKAMNEVARGNLEHELTVSDGDALEDYTDDCRHMLETLRRLLYRDRQSAVEAGELIAQCQKTLAEEKGDRKKVIDTLNLARSELSVINFHFMKGREAKP